MARYLYLVTIAALLFVTVAFASPTLSEACLNARDTLNKTEHNCDVFPEGSDNKKQCDSNIAESVENLRRTVKDYCDSATSMVLSSTLLVALVAAVAVRR